MRQGSSSPAYTIVEAMIFLAVSAALLVSAMTLVAGQQQKTEFNQAIRAIDTEIQDIINNVATGYYANIGNFVCTSDGTTGPQLSSSGTNNQGANTGCIFIGRAIQFDVNGSDGKDYKIYNIVGQRLYNDGGNIREALDLSETRPTAIAPSAINPGIPDSSESRILPYGLRVVSMQYNHAGVPQDIGAVAFISTLGSLNASGNLVGAQVVELRPVKTTVLDEVSGQSVDKLNNAANLDTIPDGGVVICFQSGGTNQSGKLTIGSSGRQLSTKLEIKSNPTCA